MDKSSNLVTVPVTFYDIAENKMRPETITLKRVSSVHKHTKGPIHRWELHDVSFNPDKLPHVQYYFCCPDANRIIVNDSINYITKVSGRRWFMGLYKDLRYNSIKMNPCYFIARDVSQIKKALKCICYCMIRIDNNEQIAN